MIKLEIDPREFRRNLTEYDRKIMPEYRKALSRSAVVFATWAARYTPPNQFNLKKKKEAERSVDQTYWLSSARARRRRGGKGRKAQVFAGVKAKYAKGDEIEPELYNRVYYYIPKLLQTTRDGTYRRYFRTAYENGAMYYVVFSDRRGGTIWRSYRDTESMRAHLPIRRRGLAKAAWGMNLGELGMRVPKNIQGLVNAAPALKAEKGKNKFVETFRDGVFKLDILNMGWEGQPDAKLQSLIRQGAEKKAVKRMDAEIHKIWKKQVYL